MLFRKSRIALLNKTDIDQIKKFGERIQMHSSFYSLQTRHLPDPLYMIQRKSEAFLCYGFYVDQKLEGYAVAYQEKRFVRGKETLVWSIGRVRISKEGVGFGFLLRLTELLSVNKWFSEYGYAYTLKGNRSVEKYASRFFIKFPHFPVMKLTRKNTIFIRPTIFPFTKKEPFEIKKTEQSDYPELLSFLLEEHKHYHLGRVYSMEFLQWLNELPGAIWFIALKNNEIKGAVFLWDSFEMNLSSIQILKISFQPKIVSISEFAVTENDKRVWLSLLESARKHAKKKHVFWIQCGGDQQHPLHKMISFPKFQIHSHLIEFNSDQSFDTLHWCDSDLF